MAYILITVLRRVILRLQGQAKLYSESEANLGYSFKILSQKERKRIQMAQGSEQSVEIVSSMAASRA